MIRDYIQANLFYGSTTAKSGKIHSCHDTYASGSKYAARSAPPDERRGREDGGGTGDPRDATAMRFAGGAVRPRRGPAGDRARTRTGDRARTRPVDERTGSTAAAPLATAPLAAEVASAPAACVASAATPAVASAAAAAAVCALEVGRGAEQHQAQHAQQPLLAPHDRLPLTLFSGYKLMVGCATDLSPSSVVSLPGAAIARAIWMETEGKAGKPELALAFALAAAFGRSTGG